MKLMFLKPPQGKLSILFLCLILFIGCKTAQTNDSKDIILESIVKKYSKNNTIYLLKYDYFKVSKYYIDSTDFVMYRVSPQLNKVVLSSNGSGYFPLDYIKVKNNFFLIDGKITTEPIPKVYNLLKEKDLIDSTMVKIEQGTLNWDVVGKGKGTVMTNSKLKVNTYIVCRKNNKIISQWRTNKSEVSAKNIEKAIKKGCD